MAAGARQRPAVQIALGGPALLLARGVASGELLGRGVGSGGLLGRGVAGGELLGRGVGSGELLGRGVRVQDVEVVRRPQLLEEQAHALADRLSREAVSVPRLFGGEEVPAQASAP